MEVMPIDFMDCCSERSNGYIDGGRIPKIDIHTHIIPREWPNWNEKFGYTGWLHIVHDPSSPEKATLVNGDGAPFRSIDCNCWSPERRIQECEAATVDIQVLSTVPGIGFNYWARPKDCLEVCRFINDDIDRVVRASPKCFVGLGTVPLQDPQLAVEELRRCVKDLGLVGVQIGSHVNDWNLDAPELDVFWQAVVELDVCVFVHPWNMQEGPRHAKHWFPWLIDMPNETTLAIGSVLMGGVYDRWPSLRLCFAHGGGSIIQLLGRIQHGFEVRPDLCQTRTSVPPKTSLRNIWVDSLVHDEDILKLLVKRIGADKIILGSDYPFPLGEVPHPGQLILGTTFDLHDPKAERALKEKLLYANAVSFLRISPNFD